MFDSYTVLSGLGPSRPRPHAPDDGLERRAVRGLEAVDRPAIRVTSSRLEPREVAELQRDPDTLLAPEMPLTLCRPVATPSPPAQGAWGLAAVGASSSPCDGRGIAVAVLDTGIDRTHPAFAGIATLTEQDFTGEGNGDRNGHGTHCASTIFGRDVDRTRIGVARGVGHALIGKILRGDGHGETTGLFRALQWAVEGGAQVISLSLGFDFPGMVQKLHQDGWPVDAATSHALCAYRANLRVFDAILRMIDAFAPWGGGSVIVAAAGNENRPPYKIGVALPAAAEGVIAVAAATVADEDGHRIAEFSNRWPLVAAPGVDILGAELGGTLTRKSGTSMAAPHVAGVAALWWQKKRSGMRIATAAAVVAALRESARRDVFARGVDDTDCGIGMVQAPA
jgi:hypothetical protein